MTDNTFIIADYSSIEARVLSWLAGQDDLTADFANNIDAYSKFATRLFGVPIRKPVEDDPEPVATYLTVKRSFGKDAILGCGYGMGAGTFYDRCLSNDSLRPLFDAGTYDMLFISKLIKTYRGTYKAIPQLWRTIEKAFRWVIKYPKAVVYFYHPAECLRRHYAPDIAAKKNDVEPENKVLTFHNCDGTVCIRLPSSRVLFYPHARIKNDGKGLAYHWSNNLWGGFLVENIVQAISRDILGEALLVVHDTVCPVVLHSHDELVCPSPKKDAGHNSLVIRGIMEHVPHWCEGLPIAVEIEISEVYKK